jgi:hypothetical protein
VTEGPIGEDLVDKNNDKSSTNLTPDACVDLTDAKVRHMNAPDREVLKKVRP